MGFILTAIPGQDFGHLCAMAIPELMRWFTQAQEILKAKAGKK